MKLNTTVALLALVLAAPATIQAHNMWLLPSQTQLSGDVDNWITVDAAVSNDLFYFNHFPLKLDGLVITAPDGKQVKPENQHQGKWRSSFDANLSQQGSYKLAVVNHGLFAIYELDGEIKRLRGQVSDLAKIPSEAKKVKVTESVNRIESFVTVGAPTTVALKTIGKGLELEPVTHPNDLYAGEKATFRLLLDGEPASDVKVVAIRGETRYRDNLGELNLTTAQDGSFSLTWPQAGMYWLEASASDDKTSIKQAQSRRLKYVATLEVLPQ